MRAKRDKLRGLYGIVGPVDGEELSDDALFRLADAFLEGGSPVLQLRHKRVDDRALVAMARELVDRAHRVGALLIVNDRLDVAVAAGADGVHLGLDDLPIAEARKVATLLRPRESFLIGLSTHDADEVKAALLAGADYVGFGPVFPTRSKTDALAVRGIERLREGVRAAGELPVVAIGGVTLENASSVREAGARMGAVISDVASAKNPKERAEALHEALARASAR